MVLPYTKIVAGASTNVVTPSNSELDQGNDQLTPYDSAKNNGYYRQISQGVADVNAEIINTIIGLGGTPNSSNNNLFDALSPLLSQATETTAGVAEIATQAETNARTDDQRIVTPLKLGFGFAISLGTNGYIKFPSWLGGLILQWGEEASFHDVTGDYTASVTFPIAFPTAVFNSSVSTKAANTSTANNDIISSYSDVTNSGMNVSMQETSGLANSVKVSWFVIGH